MTRQLLRAAYPDGYLGIKGVSTVAGFICLGPRTLTEPESKFIRWHHNNLDGERFDYIHFGHDGPLEKGWPRLEKSYGLEPGALLPRLEPSEDIATWSCAKCELAEAIMGIAPALALDEDGDLPQDYSIGDGVLKPHASARVFWDRGVRIELEPRWPATWSVSWQGPDPRRCDLSDEAGAWNHDPRSPYRAPVTFGASFRRIDTQDPVVALMLIRARVSRQEKDRG